MSIKNKSKKNNVKDAKVRPGSRGRAFTGKDAEFAILKVAYLLSAIDGEVAESEKETFDRLAARCREVDVDEAKDVIRSAHASVEKLLAAYKGKKASPLAVFMSEVKKVCDWSAFVRNSALVRKAFVMWVAMVVADGVIADVEQRAIRELQAFVNSFSLIDDAFLLATNGELLQLAKFDRALKMAKDLQTDRRLHEKIEKSQIRLAAMVQGQISRVTCSRPRAK